MKGHATIQVPSAGAGVDVVSAALKAGLKASYLPFGGMTKYTYVKPIHQVVVIGKKEAVDAFFKITQPRYQSLT